ncbi:MAG: hypothetical protein KBA51_07645 [Kiritimatiellae bacterium]|nr:hypothetical protein [Kiritimatiellia bacterium]
MKRLWFSPIWGYVWAWAAFWAGAADAAPRFAMPFGDHMVLQRETSLPIWGTAEPGERVEVRWDGQLALATADDRGYWMVRLDPAPASDSGSVLGVRNTKGEGQDLADVLVGDVWLCSGQSNMRWSVEQSEGADGMIASADIPGLRWLHWRDHAERPVGLDPSTYFRGAWTCSSPEQARDFSAVAFAFGRELRRHSNVPVGLILNAVGGSPMISWLPESVVRGRPEYAVPPGEPPFMTPALRGWVLKTIQSDTGAGESPPPASWPSHPYQPSYLFTAGIEPLRPMAMAGVIWYQGESDAEQEDPTMASLLLRDLVRSWRAVFQSPRLPFLMVQLPRIDSPDRVHWPVFREVQRRVAREIPGVYLVGTMDLGVFGANVHSPRKIPVGERLASIARAEVLGERVDAFGPDVARVCRDGSAVRVTFRHAAGLRVSDASPPRGFELAAADGVFHAAQAVLENEGVRVASEAVPEPETVRYGWHMNADLNLTNAAGLPAMPFTHAVQAQ